MKPPDEALVLLVRQWIAKAEVDYRTAERLVRDDEPIRESIAFHCQQTAEKYLKAFLVWRQVEFPKDPQHQATARPRVCCRHGTGGFAC